MNVTNTNSRIEEIQKRLELSQKQALAFSRDFAFLYRKEHDKRQKLRQTHQKLRTIVDSMSDAMVATDNNLIIRDCNSAFYRMFSLRNKNIENLSLANIMPEELVQTQIRQLKSQEKSAIRFEFSPSNQSKTIYWTNLSKICDSDQKDIGYIFLFRDITELRKIDRLGKQLMTLASKELQTPFMGLLGFMNLVYENIQDRLSREETSYFEFLINSCKNFQKVIGDKMTDKQCRDEGGLIKSIVPLGQLIQETIHKLEENIKDLEITLQSQIDDNITLFMDKDLMAKALFNILKTIISYTKQNGSILIKTNQNRESFKLQFHCPDIGKNGWTEINKMLHSVDAYQEMSELIYSGLSLAKEIIEWHDGEITLQNHTIQLNLMIPAQNKAIDQYSLASA